MSIDETRAAWGTGGHDEGRRRSDAELLDLVLARSAAFQRTIRRRDLAEILAAGLVLLFLVPVLLVGSWIARAGVALLVAGCILIAFVLTRARRLPAPRPDQPLVDAVRAERNRVRAQARLLETVLYWYLGPPVMGSLLVVAGTSGRSWFTLGYSLFAVSMAWAIYALNQAALRRQLRPRLAELDGLLARLEA